MKKVKVFFLILFSILLFYTNKTYATTTGTYVVSEHSGVEKFILIAIGIISVILVLFIGYKMDKKEEEKKRREKFIKDNKKENEEDIYASMYKTTNNTVEEIYDEKDMIQEDLIDNYEEEYAEEDEEIYEEEDGEFEEKITEDFFPEIHDESIETDEDVVDISKSNRNIDEMINVLGNSDSTMVFNSQLLKDENIDVINKIKGYDYEEDDLSELEKTIKEANIKKYVRNREAEEKLKQHMRAKAEKEMKPTTKRYTRKKEKKEEPKNNVKRYTRKKIVNQPIDEQIEEVIIKREDTLETGRIKESEIVEKSKRGRPRKSETAEKPKRGRPKKTESVLKTKKSTTRKKGTSKTTKTTKKK